MSNHALPWRPRTKWKTTSRRIPKGARVLTEKGVVTHADLVLAALLAAEHGNRHQPGKEPRCPKCQKG